MDFSGWELRFYELLDKIPFDISIYHPYIVDFAIVLPILAIFLQWISIISPDKGYQNSVSLIFFMGTFFIFLAFATGKASTPEIKPILTIPGQNLFDIHQSVGTYLVLAFFVLLILKLISNWVKKSYMKYLVTVVMTIALIVLFYQAQLGNELVFQHGAGMDVYERF